PESRGDPGRADVRGIDEKLGHRLLRRWSRDGVVNAAPAVVEATRVEERGVGGHRPIFQSGGQRNDLEDRAGLVAPRPGRHVEERDRAWPEAFGIVEVERRPPGEGENGPAARIEDDDDAPYGLVLGNGGVELALREPLDVAVDRQR